MYQNYTDLFLCCQLGSLDTLRILLDWQRQNKLELINTIWVRFLFNVVYNMIIIYLGQRNNTALMQACANGHESIVKFLLEIGANVNLRTIVSICATLLPR